MLCMTVARRHLHELESKKKNAQHCLHTTTILIIVVRWVVEAEGGRDTRQRSQTTDNCLDFGPLRGAIVIRVTCDYHNPEPYTYVVRFPSTWMSPCDFDRQKKKWNSVCPPPISDPSMHCRTSTTFLSISLSVVSFNKKTTLSLFHCTALEYPSRRLLTYFP